MTCLHKSNAYISITAQNEHLKKLRRNCSKKSLSITISLTDTLCKPAGEEQKPRNRDDYGVCCGSPSWTRTNDPAVNSRMLF
jgi:hypothetical protein